MTDLSDAKKKPLEWRTLQKYHNYEATECGMVRLVKKKNLFGPRLTGKPPVHGSTVYDCKGPILKYGRDGVGLFHPVNGQVKRCSRAAILEMWQEAVCSQRT